ncbi:MULTISPECIES: acyl carrier protein [unclassified Frankia]|uniref:acyl carrier protein n=1 Tax=unclassified Frankia TaxID=2632575 RepID=UPI002024B49E
MSTRTVEDAVATALANRLQMDKADIDLDLPMHLLPRIESVVILSVVVDLEDVLGVTIPDDVPFEAVTARDLAALVQELM